ncbi:MAG: zf-TFIIB domain-containing protein [Polyangiales bacterium]
MPAHPIACPVCGQSMQKQNIPQGIELDLCNEHGVWLDRGELEAMLLRETAAKPARGGRAAKAPAAEGGFGATLERAGAQFGRSAVYGAGSTMGRRAMNGVIDALFGRR